MVRASLTALCLATLFALAPTVQADGPNVPAGVNAPTMTLELGAGDAGDTTLTHFYRRYYGGYGYRPYYNYSYYRPYYSYSYSYRPYYGYSSYSYYRPYYGGYGYSYGYRPYYSGYYYGGYCGISGDTDNLGTASNLGDLPSVPQVNMPQTVQQPASNFNYNGDPSVVPQPNATVPQVAPQPQAQPKQQGGLLVSIPTQQPTEQFAFPAFGETNSPTPAPQGNFAFPAYGQQGGSNFGTNR